MEKNTQKKKSKRSSTPKFEVGCTIRVPVEINGPWAGDYKVTKVTKSFYGKLLVYVQHQIWDTGAFYVEDVEFISPPTKLERMLR